jgi:hypothetical protein
MSMNLACEGLINTIAATSVAGALLPVFLLYAAFAWMAFTVIVWRHNDFVRPKLSRS